MGRKRDKKEKEQTRSYADNGDSGDSSDDESLTPFIEGMRTTNMLFVHAKAADVRDIILTEVQLEKHDLTSSYDSEAWVVSFPEDDPIVQIKLMRDRERGLICIDLSRLGSDNERYEFFLKWEKTLRQRIKEEI